VLCIAGYCNACTPIPCPPPQLVTKCSQLCFDSGKRLSSCMCMPLVVGLPNIFSANFGFGCLKLGYRAGQRKLSCVFAPEYVLNHAFLSLLPECRHQELFNVPSHSKRTSVTSGTGNCQFEYVHEYGLYLCEYSCAYSYAYIRFDEVLDSVFCPSHESSILS
jgi:hypothetical protein